MKPCTHPEVYSDPNPQPGALGVCAKCDQGLQLLFFGQGWFPVALLTDRKIERLSEIRAAIPVRAKLRLIRGGAA